MLVESYRIRKDDWIIVHAAAGGVGLILCQVSPISASTVWNAHQELTRSARTPASQIAAHFGAHVIGTTSTLEKADLARANGAEVVVVGGAEGALQAAVSHPFFS